MSRIPPPIAEDVVGWSANDASGLAPSSPTSPIVAMVGRLDELKAPEILLDALRLLRDEIPGLSAVLAGSANRDEAPDGEDYGEWVVRTAKKNGLVVELTGQLSRSRVLELYRTSRVVVVPSRYESFSMTALEAMAIGTPVIVSSSCGIASWLSPLGKGWVVPTGDPEALASAMKPLLTDANVARAAGLAGAVLAMEEFAPAAIARSRTALYGSLL